MGWHGLNSGSCYGQFESSGAFYKEVHGSMIDFAQSRDGNSNTYVGFDASLCSDEYTENGSLQVPALQTLVCIKS